MSKGRVHIIGAGLAGLSAALHASARGGEVILYEGAQQAGGRCRSYFDKRLGRQIDNGNHLVLSGNRAVGRYLALADASGSLVAAASATFPFVDLSTDERWEVAINDGLLPWWTLAPKRRPPGVNLRDIARGAGLLAAGPTHSVSGAVGAGGMAERRFWEPMAMAVVNLPPAQASASMLRATALRAWRDGRLARPMFAPCGLGPALIDPALKALEAGGTQIHFGQLLRSLERGDGRITKLHFAQSDPVTLAPGDRLILALPPERLAALMPDITVPQGASAILNAHFLVDRAALPEPAPPLLGIVGGLTQWIFVKGEIISLTVSAADHLEGTDAEEEALLARLWQETVKALNLKPDLSFTAARIVREKRATFLQTPENVARRPAQRTAYDNLFLAGDFVDTGLPATIEGAVLSGERAAKMVC
ncbi:MAG: hydroxysqualene dehydroxylase HpnE [Parvularcula sp.]|nr:hydroxysqualene dehydroxylase HpnE [Parvularcula sp.]